MHVMARNGILGRILVVALVIGVLSAAPAAALAANPSDPFHGSYRSTDFDGSNQLLAFGGPDAAGGPSAIRRVIYLDDDGTICGGSRFFAEGVGFVEGYTIVTFLEQYCGNASNQIDGVVIEFAFDPATGTLTDSFGIVWSRP